jgi:putative copper export protein/cytochrome c oxidase assembly factor CtaG
VDRTLARTTPWLIAVAVVLLSSALAGVLVVSAPPGIPVSSVGVQVLIPVMRLVADLAGILVVGCLLAAGILLDSPNGDLSADSSRMLLLGSRVALAWLVATFVGAVLTLADVFGLPVASALDERTSITFLTQSVVGHAFVAQMIGAAVIAIVGPLAGRRWQANALLGVAVVTMASRSTAGHSGVSGDHEVVALLLAVHVIAVSLWVGGLAAIGLMLLRGQGVDISTARRFSAVALWCVAAVAVTGLAQVLLRIPHPIDLFTTPYGLLLVVKTILVSVLIALGWLQRRRSLPALEHGGRGPFAMMVFIEIVLMAVVLGVSVTLSRTPTTSRGEGSGVDAHVHGLPGPPSGIGSLLAAWRIDGVMVLAGLVLAIAYTVWRSRARSQDREWDSRFVACFAGGLIVLLLVACSGLGTYSRLMASSLLIHTVLLVLVVPALVVLGVPAQEMSRQRWSMRRDPGIPVVITLAFLVAVFATPALGYLLWPFWGRAFLDVMFLGLGLWTAGAVIAAARRSGRFRHVPLIAFAAGLMVLIAAALLRPGILAPEYFAFFVPPFAGDLVQDELVGFLVAGIVVLGWLAALLTITAQTTRPSSTAVDTVALGVHR